MIPDELPKPDQFGNYWLWDTTDYISGPAIFPSKKLVRNVHGDNEVKLNGYWIASTGDQIMWNREAKQFRQFRNPRVALIALRGLANDR